MKIRLFSLILSILLLVGFNTLSFAESIDERIADLEERITKLESLLQNGNTDSPLGELIFSIKENGGYNNESWCRDNPYAQIHGDICIYSNGFEKITDSFYFFHFSVLNNSDKDIRIYKPYVWINNGECVMLNEEENPAPSGKFEVLAGKEGKGALKLDFNDLVFQRVDTSSVFLIEIGCEIDLIYYDEYNNSYYGHGLDQSETRVRIANGIDVFSE